MPQHISISKHVNSISRWYCAIGWQCVQWRRVPNMKQYSHGNWEWCDWLCSPPFLLFASMSSVDFQFGWIVAGYSKISINFSDWIRTSINNNRFVWCKNSILNQPSEVATTHYGNMKLLHTLRWKAPAGRARLFISFFGYHWGMRSIINSISCRIRLSNVWYYNTWAFMPLP